MALFIFSLWCSFVDPISSVAGKCEQGCPFYGLGYKLVHRAIVIRMMPWTLSPMVLVIYCTDSRACRWYTGKNC